MIYTSMIRLPPETPQRLHTKVDSYAAEHSPGRRCSGKGQQNFHRLSQLRHLHVRRCVFMRMARQEAAGANASCDRGSAAVVIVRVRY